MLQAVLLLGIVASSQAAWLIAGPDWNGLIATWGLNPFSTKNFDQLPRTEAAAKTEGWIKTGACTESNTTYYRGNRYINKNRDPGLMLLFGVNGYIAGIQSGISTKLLTKERLKTLKYRKAFNVEDDKSKGDRLVLTAYFVPPNKICSKGRNKADFDKQGNGLHLYLQEGPDPVVDSVLVPNEEDAAKKLTKQWQPGKCLYTIGRHYLRPYSLDMNCNDLYPMFLVYNSGKLNGFGFLYGVHHTSPRFEEVGKDVYNFFKPTPKCMKQPKSEMSSVHLFFAEPWALDLLTNFC